MDWLKQQISTFNEKLNNLRWTELKLEEILPKLEKEIWIIFSDIKALQFKKENKELLINILLKNIDVEKNNSYRDMEIFSKSKLYMKLLEALENFITSYKIELENILQIKQKEVTIVKVDNGIKKIKELKETENNDQNIVEEINTEKESNETKIEIEDDKEIEDIQEEDWNNIFFDELEEYLQLDIESSDITQENREEILDEYKWYISNIGKKMSKNVAYIINKQSKKTSWRYSNFLSTLNQLIEENLKKDSEVERKEENLKRLHELRKNKDKRLTEKKLIENIVMPKHKEYQRKMSDIIEGFILSKDYYIDVNGGIIDMLTNWNLVLYNMDNLVKERENYLTLNMYNKYRFWDMGNWFKTIYKEIENIKKVDATSILFLKTFPKFKDTINNTLDRFLDTMSEKNKEIETLYQQIEKQIETLEK